MGEDKTKQLNDFYEWFFSECDFGPAHDDVIYCMFNDYQEETGVDIRMIMYGDDE